MLIKEKNKIASIVGTCCLILAVFVLEYTVIAGIFSILGLTLLLCGGRYAKTRSDVITNLIAVFLGYCIRFCGVFGTKILYTLLCALLFIPFSIFIEFVLYLDRRLQKASKPILAVISTSLFFSIIAFLMATFNLGFLTNLSSYIMCIPVIAVNLSLFGEYVMTFFLTLIPLCLLSIGFEHQLKTRIVFLIITFVLSVFLLVRGAIIERKTKEPDYTIKVALATSQFDDFTGSEENIYTWKQQLEMFTKAIKQASESNAKLLVLNEEYFMWYNQNMDIYLSKLSEVIRQYKIPTLVCMELVSEGELGGNKAVFIDADGTILYSYDKNNLVPFIEAGSYVNGEEKPAVLQTTIDGHLINLAYIICFDINDEVFLKKIPSDTELLIVPSWDWNNANIEQRRTAIRSASLNTTLLKHSYDGFSFVSCPNGQCIETIDYRNCYETVKTINVPIWRKR